MGKKKSDDHPEIEEILHRLASGEPDDVVCLFIPSHDRDNRELDDQEMWAEQALRLFGELYTGATAFENLTGIYLPRDGSKPMIDKPIMVQSLARREDVANEDHLMKLSRFCRNMGEKTRQHSIGVIVNNYFINIRITKS